MTVLTRDALFEDVWTRPLTQIAAELGVSDVGLRKICDRHQIPTPGRGYWAQVRAGRTFRRPQLKPVADPRLEQVPVVGGSLLPEVVRAAMQSARAQAAATPRALRKRAQPAAKAAAPQPVADDAAGGSRAADPEPAADAPSPVPRPERRELARTRKALEKARPAADGFVSLAGPGVVTMKIGHESKAAALSFLTALLDEGEARGWKLLVGDGPARLQVDGETIAFRLEERADKAPHTPTPKELARKKERDRWGGDHQTWPTWDLSPSGRLAMMVEDNAWSRLRRSFLQRKGGPLEESLETIVAGLAGHAAFKVNERREEEERARRAALAQARHEREQAFARREARRAEFTALVEAQLAERARLEAVLAHIAADEAGAAEPLADWAAWLRRRLKAIDALLDPEVLEVSARHSEVDFAEPPRRKPASQWYAPKIELTHWVRDPAEPVWRGRSELDWAIGEELVADPRRDPPAPASKDSDDGVADT